MVSPPRAYFLTWTCYGTWLHHDPRGSVDKQHNQFRTPLLPPDHERSGMLRRSLRWAAVMLDGPMRAVVRVAISDHANFRTWRLAAMNVRTNHVHVVVSTGSAPPEQALEQFKSWSTRRLREANLIEKDRPVWTSHGSTIYLWTPWQVESKVHYVKQEQGPDI